MTVESEKALAWMKAHYGQFGYSNHWRDRLDPVESGVGDCSSTIRAAYLATSGINPGLRSK